MIILCNVQNIYTLLCNGAYSVCVASVSLHLWSSQKVKLQIVICTKIYYMWALRMSLLSKEYSFLSDFRTGVYYHQEVNVCGKSK